MNSRGWRFKWSLVSVLLTATVLSAAAETISLDGQWLLATDAQNTGRDGKWWNVPRLEAKPAKVPWIIQDAFPGYHGVAWYWKDFEAPVNPIPGGRALLRFWQVEYKADVWLNGVELGSHEGSESAFTFDVTGVIRPGGRNLLAVRVLNPTHEPIDGIVLNQTPHSNKVMPYGPGNGWNLGGIVDSVELLEVPAVRVEDLHVIPNWKTGEIRVTLNLRNAGKTSIDSQIQLSAAPAATGETLVISNLSRKATPGDTLVEASIQVSQPHLWNLDDPFLYRVTARVETGAQSSGGIPPVVHEDSERCGFRDFRFADGAFRLNGKRIYLRCSHTGNACPIGLEMPHDPDYLRRDFINQKMMRFNSIRFLAGLPKRYQLDLADEIGLLVYEEPLAAWCLEDSPKMKERYDESVLGMVRRDRNHPCVVMWGLLNETQNGPVFRHAVEMLPELRKLDESRVIMLNSGRFDDATGKAPVEVWRNGGFPDPCITHNGSTEVVRKQGIRWPPGQLGFHPGGADEYAVVRWTAPMDGTYEYSAEYNSIAELATTDVHVLRNNEVLFDDLINLGGRGPRAHYSGKITAKAGDTIDSACGFGNGNNGSDSTGLSIIVKSSSGQVWDASKDFSAENNPSGAWSFGMFKPGPRPDCKTFDLFSTAVSPAIVGSISNPGTSVWEDILAEAHPYQHVPHTEGIIQALRTMGGGGKPLWLSEYGVGSAVDLPRVVNWYEQAGKPNVEDARLYRNWRDQFLADWQRYRLDEVFDRPEDFFIQSMTRMSNIRLQGLNAIRANPNVIGYSLTGTLDQGMTGEGVWTTFRELKPGSTDTLFDGWAPLRWCLFATPANIYRGQPVKLEAVLANEDVLAPGEYTVRFQVIGPNLTSAMEKRIVFKIADPKSRPEPPMVQPIFSTDVVIDGPPGEWKFMATFEKGAAACGEEIKFFVDARSEEMPKVDRKIVLLSRDNNLAEWLRARGIKYRAYVPGVQTSPEVILASGPPPGNPSVIFPDLAKRIGRGSSVIYLTPETYARDADSTGWLPLAQKGRVKRIARWLYHGDDWAKQHPIFDGLQAGGLLDYDYYAEIIPDDTLVDLDPATDSIAGAIDASDGYQSGVTIAVCKLGAGEVILNTLRIRENLGKVPEAERLLRNMLRFAGRNMNRPLSIQPASVDQPQRLAEAIAP